MCKRGVWYLVATAPNGLRTCRLSRVRAVEVSDDPVERPDGFDLAAAWSGVQDRLSARVAATVVVQVAVHPVWLARVRATVGSWWPIEESSPAGDGRAALAIRFPSVAVAAAELVGPADHLEAASPQEVRAEMAEIGRRLVVSYGEALAPASLTT